MTPADQAAAWLARLPPSQLAAAHAHTDVRLVAWLGGLALLLAACALLSRAGLMDRIARRLQSARPRPWLTSAAAAVLLTLILATLKAAFDALMGAWGDQVLAAGGGVAPGPGLSARLAAAGGGVAPVMIAALIFVPLILWLMRRAPRAWPLIAGAALTAAILLVGWLPYALSLGPPLTPLPAGPVRDGLTQLIAHTGLPAHQVWFAADPPGFDADVTGGFGAAQVSVGPELAAAPPAETRAYVAHIMGHYVHGDILNVSLLVALTLFVGMLAVQRLAAPLARLTGARAVQSPADPAALPAVAALAILGVAAAMLVAGAYLRWANVGADAYSLNQAREPDGLAAVLEREWDHASVDPSPLETLIFYTHPPLEGRLQQIAAWKASTAPPFHG
jgi:Zn-dependent protease with chaperone function